MRNLLDIIEDCKAGERPDYDELRYAVLALDSMLLMDHRNLREELLKEPRSPQVIRELRAQNSFDMLKGALNKAPNEWIGWSNDPDNPEYQKLRDTANRVLDKVIKSQGADI